MENCNSKDDWRTKAFSSIRQSVINKMVDSLKKLLPFICEATLQHLNKVAIDVEGKVFSTATSQTNYLLKIHQKMLTIKHKIASQNGMQNSAVSGASQNMQQEVGDQGQFPIPLQANQSQGRQWQSNRTSTGTQATIHNVSRRNLNQENMISVPKNLVSNAMGQIVPANVCVSAQQQMPMKPVVLQQQPNPNPILNQQEMFMKQYLQQGINLPQKHPMQRNQLKGINLPQKHHMQPNQLTGINLSQKHEMRSNQLKGTNLSQKHHMQPNQLKYCQQSGVQTTSVMQPSSFQKSVLRQQSGEASVTVQPIERLINAVKSASPDALSAAVTDIDSVTIDTIPDPDRANHGSVTSASEKSMPPIERLIKVVKSMSPKALSSAIDDISSAICSSDRIPESNPANGTTVGAHCGFPTTASGESNFITQDRITRTRKRNRHFSAIPKPFDMATASSSVKRPRIEVNHALLEEIRETNHKLVDTVVDVSSDEIDRTAAATFSDEGEGTVVKCSFSAVALSPSFKSQYSSAQMSQIQPLKFLVPSNYPNSAPLLLGKFPAEVSNDYENLSEKTRSRFGDCLRTQVMSVAEIARRWDVCARAVVSEHAEQSGGGTFSSKFGTWENCAA